MAITGVASYSQAATLKSPAQNNQAFEDQNTQNQQAAANFAQPREAEVSQSIASANDFSSNRFDDPAVQNTASTQASDASQDDDASTSSRIEGFSASGSEPTISRDAPRGSVVDFVV